MGRSCLASLLAAILLAGAATSCAGRAPVRRDAHADEAHPPPEAPSPELLRVARGALEHLEAVEGEPFGAFVHRARAALIADDHPSVHDLAEHLPDDLAHLHRGWSKELGALFVASWAKRRARSARVATLQSLVRHKTINPAGVETPGRTPDFDAFEADIKARAKRLGLRFLHTDHVAYEVGLEGGADAPAEERVGVLVHGDVVPANEPGWSTEPFAGTLKDDAIHGRGAMDDKGALVAALFALDALQDSGVPLAKHPILVVGTSEETHWSGIDRYAEKRGLPSALFVADGAFPVGVGEKGVSTVRIKSAPAPAVPAALPAAKARLVGLEGGEVSNQVPATAKARLVPLDPGHAVALREQLIRDASAAEGMRLVVVDEGGHIEVRATGDAAHGASPGDGHNAVSDLVRFVRLYGALVTTPCTALLDVLDDKLGTGHDGAGLGVADAHPRFSPSTINLGTVRMSEDGACEAALNVRWPPPRTAKEIVKSVGDAVRAGLEAVPGGPFPVTVEGGGLDPFLVEETGHVVSALVSSYELVVGEEGEPVTLSGTTYAKAAPGSVTFGPGKPGAHSRIHGPDEHITLAELDELTEVYTLALLRLARAP
jgi:succinyl-diaminopimelate desuccinylase